MSDDERDIGLYAIASAIRDLDIEMDKSADTRMVVDALGHLADSVEMQAYCRLAASMLPAKATPEKAAEIVTKLRGELRLHRHWYGFGVRSE